MNYSPFQIEIFKAIQSTQNNICVEATAGSGKTTTILEALKLIPRTKKSIFLSFSNTIVNELKSRVPDHVEASTLHSLGCRMITSYYRGVKIDEKKWFKKLINELKPEERIKSNFQICGKMSSIIDYARMTLTTIDPQELRTMCNYYGLEYTEKIIKDVVRVLSKEEKSVQVIDFADMIYLPATKHKLINRQFDYVFLDEAQDLNNAQRSFIEKILKTNGRLIAVGDSSQSIYSFSGSSIDSFDILKSRPNTTELPLSISYRCARNIVKEAQKVFGTIQPFDGAVEGEVRRGLVSEIESGDMVLSRTTAPLVFCFFKLIDRGIKARVLGKDIETGLIDLAEKVQSRTKELTEELILKEKEKLKQELTDLKFKNVTIHPRYQTMLDKIAVIQLILDKYNDPGNITSIIREIFREDKTAVRLMTIHRSKGLENDKVFLIEKYEGKKTIPSPYAEQHWEKVQERNLLFVAITRAKKELVYIDM